MSKRLYLPLCLGLFVPGSAWLFTQKAKLAILPLVVALVWVAVLASSRWVIEPIGFVLLLVGLLGIHLLNYALAITQIYRGGAATITSKHWAAFFACIIIYSGAGYLCHTFKAQWFGFAFYHIPSASMTPTLKVGDVVVVDTWSNQVNTITKNDVIVLKRSANDFVLAKRLKDIRNNHGQWELYLVGDNPSGSVDSRQFGWVSSDYIIGKISFVWFSFNHSNRRLVRVN